MDYCQSLLSFTLRRWVQTWLNYQIIYISKYHLTKFVDRNGATFGRKWMRWSCGAKATPKKVEAGNIPRKLWCQKPFYILVKFYTCWNNESLCSLIDKCFWIFSWHKFWCTSWYEFWHTIKHTVSHDYLMLIYFRSRGRSGFGAAIPVMIMYKKVSLCNFFFCKSLLCVKDFVFKSLLCVKFLCV